MILQEYAYFSCSGRCGSKVEPQVLRGLWLFLLSTDDLQENLADSYH
jgi:hypothetical protein